MELSINEERRKHPRIERIGLVVHLEGEIHHVTNWSMGGFLLNDYEGSLSIGALVTVDGIGSVDGELLTVDLPARVVRTDDGRFAVSYLGLDAPAYTFLTEALGLTGEMRNLV